MKSIEWLEKDWLVYGRGGEVGVKVDKIRQQNGQIHEFDKHYKVLLIIHKRTAQDKNTSFILIIGASMVFFEPTCV